MPRSKNEFSGIHVNDFHNENNTATYCPEDDKLRLYIGDNDGRVERETYLFLADRNFKSTPKQDCNFVVKWSERAEDICLMLIAEGDDIGDEDQSPQERAAQRAERFAGYREKRRAEAHGLADRYDDAPSTYGAQNSQRAERQAQRRDRIGARAYTQWEKAEYWQHRTAGVISHALYTSSAEVRRGRIRGIEKDIRKIEAQYTPSKKDKPYPNPYHTGEGEPELYVLVGQGRAKHPVKISSLERIKEYYKRTLAHLKLRLAYELQMIGEQGGKAEDVEIIAGGWIKTTVARRTRKLEHVDGWAQIVKVNKSPTTGKAASVVCMGYDPFGYADPNEQTKLREIKIDIERAPEDAYRAPTPEELAEFQAKKKQEKKSKPAAPKLINPTNEDAERLQQVWNQRAKRDGSEIVNTTQSKYSFMSRGDCCGTIGIDEDGKEARNGKPAVFKIRRSWRIYNADAIIVLTDKPQKPLPLDWEAIEAEFNPTPEPVAAENLTQTTLF